MRVAAACSCPRSVSVLYARASETLTLRPGRRQKSQSETNVMDDTNNYQQANKRNWTKPIIAAVLFSVMTVAVLLLRKQLSLSNLVELESTLTDFREEHPLLIYGLAFVIYVTVTALSLPGATIMSVMCAWLFGFWRGLILVSFASTSGATLAFLVARYLLREWANARFGARLKTFKESLDKEGAFYLFTLRLIPYVPFFIVNAVMGLTKMRVRTFWWVSQLGMIPGTCLYLSLGANLPKLSELSQEGLKSVLRWQFLVAFVLIGIFPIIAKRVIEHLRGKRISS